LRQSLRPLRGLRAVPGPVAPPSASLTHTSPFLAWQQNPIKAHEFLLLVQLSYKVWLGNGRAWWFTGCLRRSFEA
ncbi:MAG: hypothetical protein N2050_11455, partial [Flavobacteriales bacterium]|nr:hypothetical protein [Flavobacteriales bacterium]